MFHKSVNEWASVEYSVCNERGKYDVYTTYIPYTHLTNS